MLKLLVNRSLDKLSIPVSIFCHGICLAVSFENKYGVILFQGPVVQSNVSLTSFLGG